MKRPRIRNLSRLASLVVLLCLVAISLAQSRRPARQPPRPASVERGANVLARPRLVLLTVVDQLRYEYLTRFGDLFGPRGTGRLMREGASWADANFDHVPTFTAPRHAVFMTRAW